MSASLAGPSPVAFRTSSGRRPRGVVKIGGQMAAFIDFEVELNGYLEASTLRVEIDAWNQPQGFPNFTLPFWGGVKTVQIEILMGYLTPQQDVGAIPTNLTSLILGQIDRLEVTPEEGRMFLIGRDLTAKLIDTRTSNRWPDQTSSQIVTALAQQAGLTPQVTATTVPVREYYDNSYSLVAREIPMWELIAFLAQNENFSTYVKGTTLYFGPPQNQSDPNPYAVNFGKDTQGRRWANVLELKLERALTLAQDVTVTVKSHNYASGTVVTAVATRKSNGKAVGTTLGTSAQNYIRRIPNLSQAQAQQAAESFLADITLHERIISAGAEGDATLDPHTRGIRLQGTQTDWDQLYFADFVGHKFSFERGYGMSFRAKNHSTVTQLAL